MYRFLGAVWSSAAPYVIPSIAAFVAIVPAFPDLYAKSFLQRGQSIPPLSFLGAFKGGVTIAPITSGLIGAQMLLQKAVESHLIGDSNEISLKAKIISSAAVGALSSPIVAIFNGQSMKWGIVESLSKFSVKQGVAITAQEAAFVGGISFADQLANLMKQKFGENKVIENIVAPFLAGAAGSLAGHPANTALTRWQNGMTMDLSQSMYGAARKARAIGIFAVGYNLVKKNLNSITEPKS